MHTRLVLALFSASEQAFIQTQTEQLMEKHNYLEYLVMANCQLRYFWLAMSEAGH